MNNNTPNHPTQLNEVEGFNPMDYVRTISTEQGESQQYLDVRSRLLWFRMHRPNGKIDSQLIKLDSNYACFMCRVYANKEDPEEQFIGKAYSQRFSSNRPLGDRFLETAETAAKGRALADAGYGTPFCGVIDDMEPVDAPVSTDTVKEEMNVQDAQNVLIDFGKYAGKTLGEIAMTQPEDLGWFVRHYTGPDKRLKSGAVSLLRAVGYPVC